jgi:hypothetical protein
MDRRTVMLDHFLLGRLGESGLDRVLPGNGETDAQYMARLQAAAISCGIVPTLLSGYLLPMGIGEQDWTPELAAQTAAHISRCDTAKDRELVYELTIEVVFGFFRQGIDWHNRFRSFSSDVPEAKPTAPENAES